MKYLRIHGPVLVGFDLLFDRSYGDPSTPRPYPRVTPTAIGGKLIPFPCPHCGAVRPALLHDKRGPGYTDHDRGFSWCPACGGRFVLDRRGRALARKLAVGAEWAPALVERKGESPRLVGGHDPFESLVVLGAANA